MKDFGQRCHRVEDAKHQNTVMCADAGLLGVRL
jgi:hypothetical protein